MPASPLARVAVEAPGTAEHLDELHAAVERFWAEADRSLPSPPGAEWRLLFTTALAEVAANVVRHAYQGGEIKGRLRVELLAFRDRLEARFTDGGREFEGDVSAPPESPASAADDALPDELFDELPESGYGLSLVRAAVDELRYERTESSSGSENQWRLVKRLPESATRSS